ncbi:MAG: DUF255 domain-containing protein [Bacteroidota bacterium]
MGICLLGGLGCNTFQIGNADAHREVFTNELLVSASPFLRSHGNDAIQWKSWEESVLQQAERQGKLLLVYLGYGASFADLQMKRQLFRDSTLAGFINAQFQPIMVDRDERPDLMAAFGLQGRSTLHMPEPGPITAIALADGRLIRRIPFFNAQQWTESLMAVQRAFQERGEAILPNLPSLAALPGGQERGLSTAGMVEQSKVWPDRIFSRWDMVHGGLKGDTKFVPYPWMRYLLEHQRRIPNDNGIQAVYQTLDQIAASGMYDQLGGGFNHGARDPFWRIPYFEKLLKDNAELITLYALALQNRPNARYAEVLYETIAFVKRELSYPNGGFYEGLYAYSQGKEGYYYIWPKIEIESALENRTELVNQHFFISEAGNWEGGVNILHHRYDVEDLAAAYRQPSAEIKARLQADKEKLLVWREKRVAPPRDLKQITEHQADMVLALAEAYRALGEREFLDLAIFQGRHLLQQARDESGYLYRASTEEEKGYVMGYLGDYVKTAQACLSLYELSGRPFWLKEAELLATQIYTRFYDPRGRFFRLNNVRESTGRIALPFYNILVQEKNAETSRFFFRLGKIIDKTAYVETARDLLSKGMRQKYPEKSWGLVAEDFTRSTTLLVHAHPKKVAQIQYPLPAYRPDVMLLPGPVTQDHPLYRRYQWKQPGYYVCQGNLVKGPFTSYAAAWEALP